MDGNFKRWVVNQYIWFKHFIIVKSNRFNCDIKCKIPKSTIIKHYGMNIVINKNVKLGENNILRHNLTLGGRKGVCEIITGYNVDFGCNVTVLGKVRIGNNVKIGANSLILKDIPDNMTVVDVWK